MNVKADVIKLHELQAELDSFLKEMNQLYYEPITISSSADLLNEHAELSSRLIAKLSGFHPEGKMSYFIRKAIDDLSSISYLLELYLQTNLSINNGELPTHALPNGKTRKKRNQIAEDNSKEMIRDLGYISGNKLKIFSEEKTSWPDEIIEKIKNMNQYEILKNAGLVEVDINGRKYLIRENIDLDYTDEDGISNRKRMAMGFAPLDSKIGKPIELRHLVQKADSPLVYAFVSGKAHAPKGGGEMNNVDSGLAHGTSGSPQLTIENQEMAEKAKENEVNVKKTYPGSRTYKEYFELARDPSHANKVLPQGRKERDIGIDLENQGILHKIIRDPQKDKGAEFIDTVTGIKWDIKSFVSHPKGATSAKKGAFSLFRAIAKIEKEFNNGHNVIIDTRRLTKSDKESLINAINDKGYSDKIIWYHKKGNDL